MRSVLLYIVLVGIPVLGVLGVLELGQSLTAPPSVAGTWNVALDQKAIVRAGCNAPIFDVDQPTLTVSQSGPRLRLTFNDAAKTTLSGSIDNTTISVNEAPIAVQADLDQPANPNRLQGQFTLNDCPSQPNVAFTATREPK